MFFKGYLGDLRDISGFSSEIYISKTMYHVEAWGNTTETIRNKIDNVTIKLARYLLGNE